MARKGGGPFGSVALLAALTAAAAAALAVLVVGEIAARSDADGYRERQYALTERVFKAAIDPRFQTKAEEVNRVLDRLVVIEAVAGGALFDDTGHLQQSFGERPYTAFETIQQTGRTVFATEDPRRIEFHYPPEATGTPFHILARVDAGTATSLERASLLRRAVLAAGAALAAGFAAFALVAVTVAGPVRRIGAVVSHMIANPGIADSGPALATGPTEVGALAAEIERFRGTLSDIWRTKVAIADAILERSPFAVIQMASDGSPTFANPAAADLFEREIVRGQGAAPLHVQDVGTASQASLRDHLLRFRGGCRLVEIPGSRSPRFAVAGSLTVGAEGKAPIVIAMFADVTDTQLARLDAEQRFATGSALLRTARRREVELKLTLESCLTLLGGPDRQADEHLDPLPYASEWLAAAKEAGIVGEPLVLNAEGPAVEAPREDLRSVIRLALLVAYARCGTAPADVIIDAKGINFETAGVTVRAQPAAGYEGEPEAVVADWQLAFAALRTAIRRVNGQLTEFTANDEGTVLRFMLRGAAERLSAVKAR